MLTEEKIEQYVSTLRKKGGKPAGKDLKRKTRKALIGMWEILKESGHDVPDESDYEEYRLCSPYDDEGTASDIQRIKKFFASKEEGSKQLSMIETDEFEIEGEAEPENAKTKSKAGRKRFDTVNGEKKSEKFMLYFTPDLIAEVRDWCHLKRISAVSYITGLIEADLHSEEKQERLNFFRKYSDES